MSTGSCSPPTLGDYQFNGSQGRTRARVEQVTVSRAEIPEEEPSSGRRPARVLQGPPAAGTDRRAARPGGPGEAPVDSAGPACAIALAAVDVCGHRGQTYRRSPSAGACMEGRAVPGHRGLWAAPASDEVQVPRNGSEARVRPPSRDRHGTSPGRRGASAPDLRTAGSASTTDPDLHSRPVSPRDAIPITNSLVQRAPAHGRHAPCRRDDHPTGCRTGPGQCLARKRYQSPTPRGQGMTT